MEYIKYYREKYFNDLQRFRQQIPFEGNKHYHENIFKIQYFQLTPSYNYLDFIEEELAATDERDEIVSFIRESERGIIKRFNRGSNDDE